MTIRTDLPITRTPTKKNAPAALKIRDAIFGEILERLPHEETPELAAMYDFIDKVFTRDQRWDFDMLFGAVMLKEVEQAFTLGWQLRDNPTSIIFE